MITRDRVTVSAGALEIGVKLTVLDCASCGVIYAIPGDLEKRARDEGTSWYCPNGHPQAFAESRADKLKAKLEAAEERARWAEESETQQRRRATSAENSLRTTRGVVTKLRKRATAGECPFGCHRHFTNLERHVASKHPGQQLEGES